MPITSWDTTTLASSALAKDRLSDLGILLQIDNDLSVSAEADKCRVDAKEELRKHLLRWAKETYPDRLEMFLNLRSSQLQNYHERLNFDFIPPYSDGTRNVWAVANGGFNPISSLKEDANPTTYYISGTPTNGLSGTLVGEATNGDVLVDASTRNFYVNRGNKWNDPTPSVTWDRFNSKDVLDHIANPEELIEAHLCEMFRRMCQKGIFTDRPNWDKRFGSQANAHEYWKLEFLNNLYGNRDHVTGRMIHPGVLTILEIDFSGDGNISDYEKSASGEEHWGIV